MVCKKKKVQDACWRQDRRSARGGELSAWVDHLVHCMGADQLRCRLANEAPGPRLASPIKT